MNHDIAKSAHSMVQAFISVSTAETREAARNALGDLRQGIDSYVMQTCVVLTYDNAAMYAPSPGPAMLLPAMSVGLTAANGLLDMAIKGGPGAAGSQTFVLATTLLHVVRRQFWTIGEILEITGLGICSRVDGSRLMQEGRTAYSSGRPCEVPKELQAAGKDAVMAWESGWRMARDDDRDRRINIEQTPPERTILHKPEFAAQIAKAGQEAMAHLTKQLQPVLSPSMAAAVTLPANDGYRSKGRQAFIAGRTRTDPMGTLYANQLQAWLDGWDAEREACIEAGRASYGTDDHAPQDWTSAQISAWQVGINQMQAMADKAVEVMHCANGVRANGAAFNSYYRHTGSKVREGDAKAVQEGMEMAARQSACDKLEAPRTDSLLAFRWGYWFMLGMLNNKSHKPSPGNDCSAWNAGHILQLDRDGEAERAAIADYDKLCKSTLAETKEITEAMLACAVDIAGGARHYPPNIKMASAAYRYGYFRRLGMDTAVSVAWQLLEPQDCAAWEAGRAYQTQVNDSHD